MIYVLQNEATKTQRMKHYNNITLLVKKMSIGNKEK